MVDCEGFETAGLQNDFRDNHSIQSLHTWMLNRRIGFNDDQKDATASTGTVRSILGGFHCKNSKN